MSSPRRAICRRRRPVGAARRGVFARADPHDLRVGVGHRDVADRDDRLVVENRLPADAVVHRLPQAARPGRRVNRVGLAGRHREVDEAAALASRADRPELERLGHVGRQGLRAEIGGEERQNERGRGKCSGEPGRTGVPCACDDSLRGKPRGTGDGKGGRSRSGGAGNPGTMRQTVPAGAAGVKTRGRALAGPTGQTRCRIVA